MKSPLIFLLYLMQRNKKRKRLEEEFLTNIDCLPHHRHSRYWKEFIRKLSNKDQRRCQRRIPRILLLSVQKSPWRRILRSRNDHALITVTGFDYASLRTLFSSVQHIMVILFFPPDRLLVTLPPLWIAPPCVGLNLWII